MIVLIFILFSMCYFPCLDFGYIDPFSSIFEKTALALTRRAISLFLRKLGCSGGLSLAVLFALKALLASEVDPKLITSSGASGGSPSWTDLLCTSPGERETGGTPGNGSHTGAGPANPVASPEEAASPPPVTPYPYQADEVIGGDSVQSIQSRLLAKDPSPSFEAIERARIDAEDRFEVKVEIIRLMAPLDPEGDWERRGARALDNVRTATGEESLERLSRILADLNEGGVQSQAFRSLKDKVFRRTEDLDENSQA